MGQLYGLIVPRKSFGYLVDWGWVLVFRVLVSSTLQFIEFNLGVLNDLWRYRVGDTTWTWISGSNTVYQPGVYVDKGNPSTTAKPGSVIFSVAGFDELKQEFLLFGGLLKQVNWVGTMICALVLCTTS